MLWDMNDVLLHFIQDMSKQKIIDVKKMSTDDNPSDIITKPVPFAKFKYCLDLVSLGSKK